MSDGLLAQLMQHIGVHVHGGNKLLNPSVLTFSYESINVAAFTYAIPVLLHVAFTTEMFLIDFFLYIPE